jgi:hypothetical protein
MSTSPIIMLVASVVLSCAALRCIPHRQPDPPATAAAPVVKPEHRGHVYRFDFVLATRDGNGGGSINAAPTAFTLTLEEGEKGELRIGKNVPLAAPPSALAKTPACLASVRQDVGLKVSAQFRVSGELLLLDVTTDVSRMDAPSAITKVTAKGKALVAPNTSGVVATIDDDQTHYQLTVTPTKLR